MINMRRSAIQAIEFGRQDLQSHVTRERKIQDKISKRAQDLQLQLQVLQTENQILQDKLQAAGHSS